MRVKERAPQERSRQQCDIRSAITEGTEKDPLGNRGGSNDFDKSLIGALIGGDRLRQTDEYLKVPEYLKEKQRM